MQSRNRFLNDLARLAGGAVGTMSALRQEVEGIVRQRLDAVLADIDLVRREEFEAMRAVAIRAREAQEALEKRVAVLEKAAAKPRRKPPARSKRTP